ncbi:MAG: hypothetical protein ACI9J3_000689 [Parvicellaceae bacterium]
MKGLEKYNAKILVAWGEAIIGNQEIRTWLTQNGYPELGVFCFALTNDNPSRVWLMENDHPHLLALINGIERNKKALDWLGVNGFLVLRNIALAADGFDQSVVWLREQHPTLVMLAGKMAFIKKQIDDDNYNPHKISP